MIVLQDYWGNVVALVMAVGVAVGMGVAVGVTVGVAVGVARGVPEKVKFISCKTTHCRMSVMQSLLK